MIENAKLMAFVATANPDQTKTFYASVLGLRLVSDDPFALVFDANGTLLRVQKVETVVAPPYTQVGWIVADIEATVRGLLTRGVTCARFPGLTQDDLGIWTAPGGFKIAWFKDPAGHILSLTQNP